MDAQLKTTDLAKRIVLWRREIDALRSEATSLFNRVRKVAAALEEAQKEDNLRPLVAALPVEADAWLNRDKPDPRGASAKEQPRTGGKFAPKKETTPSKE